MKKIFAILVTICLIASTLCIMTVPTSASPDFSVAVYGHGYNGQIWIISLQPSFEDAWNEATYYATHLDEAWNSAVRYESEADRPEVEGFSHMIVELYDDWNADENGSFGSGEGFKDGAIYVPADAKITVDLRGYSINSTPASDETIQIAAGADVTIENGNVIGDIHADKQAKVSTHNLHVTGDTVANTSISAYTASAFGEGSLAMIIAITALVSSAVSIILTVSYNKKKAAPASDTAQAKGEE